MPVFETFAKRMKKQRGDVLDVFQYETAPEPFRIQIVQIMRETLGEKYTRGHRIVEQDMLETYKGIVVRLRRELGVFMLPQSNSNDDFINELTNYVLYEEEIEELLSAIELICLAIEYCPTAHPHDTASDKKRISKSAIEEINHRLREHCLGYEYNGEIIRIDNELIHTETVKPALKLLANKKFKGAQQEFLSAYEHYRKDKHKEALNDALKSLESTFKAIFDKRKWPYDSDRDTSSKLIQIALDNGLIPQYWQGHFSGLRSTLESGVPTARNRNSGHGQGSIPKTIPPHLVGYVLHMTAAAIVFLVKSDEANP